MKYQYQQSMQGFHIYEWFLPNIFSFSYFINYQPLYYFSYIFFLPFLPDLQLAARLNLNLLTNLLNFPVF